MFTTVISISETNSMEILLKIIVAVLWQAEKCLPPQNVCTLISGTYEYVTLLGNGDFAHIIHGMNSEMGRLSWIIR